MTEEIVIKRYKSGRVKIQMYRKGKPYGAPMYALSIRTTPNILEMLFGTDNVKTKVA